MRRTLILLTVLSSSIQGAMAQTQPAVLDYNAEQTRLRTVVISKKLAAERGRISLKGVIVDDQGQPVTGATLTMEGSRVVKDGTDVEKYTLPTQEVDGRLDIQVDDVLSLILTFKSDNYYSRQVEFTTTDGFPPFWWHRPKQPGKELKAGLDLKDVRLVLDKHGSFQKLAVTDQNAAYVSYDPAGKCTIFDLSHPMDKLQEVVPGVADPAQLPPECIYLTTPLDDQGRVAVQTLTWFTMDLVYPRGMRLVMRGGGGFATVPVVREDAMDQLRWMREAPETGYKPELVLDAEAIASMVQWKGDAGHRLYFYFKTSRGYGKGRVSFMSNEAKPPQAYMVLQLQENGSRNVTAP